MIKWPNLGTEQEIKKRSKHKHNSDLSWFSSFSSSTMALFGQSGFNIQNIRNIHIYTKGASKSKNDLGLPFWIILPPTEHCLYPESLHFHLLWKDPSRRVLWFKFSSQSSDPILKQWITVTFTSKKSLYINKSKASSAHSCCLIKREYFFENISNIILY